MLNLLLALVIGPLTAADQPKVKLYDKEIQDRLSNKITFAGDGGPLCDAAGYLCARDAQRIAAKYSSPPAAVWGM